MEAKDAVRQPAPARVVEILAVIDCPPNGKSQGFYCGIVLWDDVVVEAADIVKYMKKWTRARVRNYCAGRGWKVSVVHKIERNQSP